MTNSGGLSHSVVLLSVLMAFGLVLFSGRTSMAGQTKGEFIDDSTITAKVNEVIDKDPDAHHFKIGVTTIQGDVVLDGFVNSRKTEERLVARISEIRGVKSVKSLLKAKDRK
ncbi:Transport-associated protein [Candidatus Sulfobium mesophilum]|uniref:Transport-associated protein n=1 Tax=Candidatus Sulfobium mesophilum TaxID=2016548 RepID=A0A2U3QEY3_9BACT|nr:Transport-associated protein [Candidatus Sulfobium mesophilum]